MHTNLAKSLVERPADWTWQTTLKTSCIIGSHLNTAKHGVKTPGRLGRRTIENWYWLVADLRYLGMDLGLWAGQNLTACLRHGDESMPETQAQAG